MKGRNALTMMVLALAVQFAVGADSWRPEVQFQLEDGGYKQTLLWVSGYAYALTDAALSNRKNGMGGVYCLPSNGAIGSKDLLNILNGKFHGERITSEQASQALIDGVRERFPCP